MDIGEKMYANSSSSRCVCFFSRTERISLRTCTHTYHHCTSLSTRFDCCSYQAFLFFGQLLFFTQKRFLIFQKWVNVHKEILDRIQFLQDSKVLFTVHSSVVVVDNIIYNNITNNNKPSNTFARSDIYT